MKLLFIFFFLPFISMSQNCDEIPTLNQEILTLANSKTGETVGRGECWDLIELVLDETNAEWDNYEVYGTLVDFPSDCVFPGDIIQFENVKLKWKENGISYYETMQHHTAIVHKVKNENLFILIHQNTGHHGRKVGTSEFRLDAIVKGKILIYRPVPGT